MSSSQGKSRLSPQEFGLKATERGVRELEELRDGGKTVGYSQCLQGNQAGCAFGAPQRTNPRGLRGAAEQSWAILLEFISPAQGEFTRLLPPTKTRAGLSEDPPGRRDTANPAEQNETS